MNARVTPTGAEVVERDSLQGLRVPPHSIEAESSLLGGLMLDSRAWDQVADILRQPDFYRFEHRIIWSAIESLMVANRNCDVVTVFTRLESMGKADEVGGLAYLNALAQFVPSARSMRGYAETIRERAMSRALIAAADEISVQAFNDHGVPAAERIDIATSQLTKLLEGAPRDDWEDADEGVVKLLDRIQVAADGDEPEDFMPTGLVELDDVLNGGFRPGQLIVVGARPSMGKTALALTIGQHLALNESHPVGMFSMEMTKQEVNERKMSMQSHIDLTRLQRPKYLTHFDWPNLTQGVEIIRQTQFATIDQSGLNINQIRAKAKALRRRMPVKLLIVDYLGLMSGTDPTMPRVYQLEEITKGLKALAKELGCAVLLLAQISRKVEDRVDQMPILSDLRDSGAIEQDADIVIFLHRPHKASPTLSNEWKHLAKVAVAKNRNGRLGSLDLMYVGANTRFMNWPEGQEKPKSLVRMKGGDL
jgi:replicative DNA helicase